MQERDTRGRMARVKSSRAVSARKKREIEPVSEPQPRDPSPARETQAPKEPAVESRLGRYSGTILGSSQNAPLSNTTKRPESPPFANTNNALNSRSLADPIQDVLREDSGSWRSGTLRLKREESRENEDGDQLSSDSSRSTDSRSTGSGNSLRGRSSAHWRKKDDTLTQYGVRINCEHVNNIKSQ